FGQSVGDLGPPSSSLAPVERGPGPLEARDAVACEGVVAGRDDHRPRVARIDHQVEAVAVPEAVVEAPPGGPAVDALRVAGAAADVQTPRRRGMADECVGVEVGVGLLVLPRRAAVGAPDNAAELDSGQHQPRLAGVGEKRADVVGVGLGREAPARSRLDLQEGRALTEGAAPVLGAEERREPGPNVDHAVASAPLGAAHVRHRDDRTGDALTDLAPGRPGVVTPPEPVPHGAGVDELGFEGVDRDARDRPLLEGHIGRPGAVAPAQASKPLLESKVEIAHRATASSVPWAPAAADAIWMVISQAPRVRVWSSSTASWTSASGMVWVARSAVCSRPPATSSISSWASRRMQLRLPATRKPRCMRSPVGTASGCGPDPIRTSVPPFRIESVAAPARRPSPR